MSVPHGTIIEPHWSWFPFYLFTLKHGIIWWTVDTYKEWIREKNYSGQLLRPNLVREIEEEPSKLGGIISGWKLNDLIKADREERSLSESRKGGKVKRWHFTGEALARSKMRMMS